MTKPALRIRSLARAACAAALLPLVSGCNMVVLDPSGDIARQQGNLVIISTALMLLIILPVMVLTALFAWRYRASNKTATYAPEWHHSTKIELVVWAAPLLIIICLGALTWVGTHMLDPYRPLSRIAPNQPIAAGVEPLEVQVVALDWKWLFIYPEQGVASVNELALPVDRPVRFHISSSSVMNSFYVPALAGQIYAMPGMETQLHAVFNRTGNYVGFSANYSGAGFSKMRFGVKSLNEGDFDNWVASARSSGNTLDRATYLALERPSEGVPVQHFATVVPNLFQAVVNLCVEPGKMCMHDMMAIDQRGGAGLAGITNVRELSYDKFAARGSGDIVTNRYVGAFCASPLDDAERARPAAASRNGQRAGTELSALSDSDVPSRPIS